MTIIELDFWKCPSRRLYLSRVDSYQAVIDKRDKKRLNLSITCKRRSAATRANVTSDDDDECNDKMTKIESTVDTVSAQFSYSSSHNSLTKLFASLIEEYFASVGFACCHNFIFLTLLHKCA